MVIPPSKLFGEESKSITSHAPDTPHASLHDTPEALDAIRVHVSTNVLLEIMVHPFMLESKTREIPVVWKTIGIDLGTWNGGPFHEVQDNALVEFLGHDLDSDCARGAIMCPNNGELLRSMASLRWIPLSDMETLVLALGANVRLVDLNRTHERHAWF